jgi:hypothetical protein
VRVSSTGRIWQIRLRHDAPDDGVVDGWQAGDVAGKWGRRKVVSTGGAHRDTGVVTAQRCLFYGGLLVSEKVWSPYDINMVPN